MTKYLLVAAALLIGFSSCFLIGGKQIRGNGTITMVERSLSGIEGVEAYGSFDVFLSVGESGVKIETDENLMEYIETEVKDGILKIKTPNRYHISPSQPVKVYVSAQSFHVIKTSGSGNITGSGRMETTQNAELSTSGSGDVKMNITAPRLSARISGSGNIVLEGKTEKLSASISGSGDIEAKELITGDADIHISGSGNTSVTASSKLDVSISGSGNVSYKGDPSVSSRISGSGSVVKIN